MSFRDQLKFLSPRSKTLKSWANDHSSLTRRVFQSIILGRICQKHILTQRFPRSSGIPRGPGFGDWSSRFTGQLMKMFDKTSAKRASEGIIPRQDATGEASMGAGCPLAILDYQKNKKRSIVIDIMQYRLYMSHMSKIVFKLYLSKSLKTLHPSHIGCQNPA